MTTTPESDGNIITYKPPLAGRVARLVLPPLSKVLPRALYNGIYEFLYVSYRWTQRQLYLLHLISAFVVGDSKQKQKARLTWNILPYTMGGYKALENAFDLVHQVDQRRIQGDLVECGVAQGGASAMMASTNRENNMVKRDKWLFDSFEGMPKATAEDYVEDSIGEVIRPLDEGSCLGTIDQVSDLMTTKLGFSKSELHFVKGWFQDTVPANKDKIPKIAVLRLDGDWYESTKIPLEAFYDKVSTGGFIIIDDYATCHGSRKAVDEFRATHSIKAPLNEDGRGGVWFEK